MSKPTFNRFLKQLRQKSDGPSNEASTTPAPAENPEAVEQKQAETSPQHPVGDFEFEVAERKESADLPKPPAPPVAKPEAPVQTSPEPAENTQSKVEEDKSKVTITPNAGNKGLNKIVLSKKQFATINSILQKLQEKTKCSAAILSDISGLVVAHKGSMDAECFSTLSALAAANYAATSEMASLVGEKEGFNMHYHEGPEYNLYVTAAQKQFIFVVVFSKETTFGMVRVLSTKVVKELIEVLSCQDEAVEEGEDDIVKDNLNDNEFHDELTSRLDSVLFGGD